MVLSHARRSGERTAKKGDQMTRNDDCNDPSLATEASKLCTLIKKAIDDLEMTTSEYQEIMAQANADGVIDEQERQLLAQLNTMLADGTVERVPG
jgi:uncharacterized membrane protein YebE (DUF533 family)